MKEICRNCRFWTPYGAVRGGELTGECKRYPPTTLLRNGRSEERRPHTVESDWCGEGEFKGSPA